MLNATSENHSFAAIGISKPGSNIYFILKLLTYIAHNSAIAYVAAFPNTGNATKHSNSGYR